MRVSLQEPLDDTERLYYHGTIESRRIVLSTSGVRCTLLKAFWGSQFQGGRTWGPRIVVHDAFTVMGVQERINNDDPKFYHTLWMECCMPYDERVKPLSTGKAYYSVYFAIDQQKFCLDGMAVGPGSPTLEGWVLREVPAGRYAAFECNLKTIGTTWDHSFGAWLPASRFVPVPESSAFEFYPPNTETDDSPVVIYLPISDKAS